MFLVTWWKISFETQVKFSLPPPAACRPSVGREHKTLLPPPLSKKLNTATMRLRRIRRVGGRKLRVEIQKISKNRFNNGDLLGVRKGVLERCTRL